ncbi:MAG: helix-turn-helix domain-containing protein [Patescibacteria group bacterium]
MIEIEDRFYTSTEVADILGVSLRSIYRYLEEGKIDAEVKTVTGRHRFTKQNILDFLYPEKNDTKESSPKVQPAQQVEVGASSPVSTQVQNSAPVAEKDTEAPIASADSGEQSQQVSQTVEQSTEIPTRVTEEVAPVVQPQPSEEVSTPVESTSSTADNDAEVDWLAKFRAAAEKYKVEQEGQVVSQQNTTVEAATVTAQPQQTQQQPSTPVEQAMPTEQVSGLAQDSTESADPSKSVYYYKSGVGGLKDIAQQLDKSASKASVEYAFTMNAGLSLHKPIKPFSLLHAYVRSGDRAFFEKSLQLTEVDQNNAQLCLLISDSASLYSNKKEMHGLNVVSDIQLKKDLLDNGEEELAKEFESIAS